MGQRRFAVLLHLRATHGHSTRSEYSEHRLSSFLSFISGNRVRSDRFTDLSDQKQGWRLCVGSTSLYIRRRSVDASIRLAENYAVDDADWDVM